MSISLNMATRGRLSIYPEVIAVSGRLIVQGYVWNKIIYMIHSTEAICTEQILTSNIQRTASLTSSINTEYALTSSICGEVVLTSSIQPTIELTSSI